MFKPRDYNKADKVKVVTNIVNAGVCGQCENSTGLYPCDDICDFYIDCADGLIPSVFEHLKKLNG